MVTRRSGNETGRGRILALTALALTMVAVGGCMDSAFEVNRTGDGSPLVELRAEIPEEPLASGATTSDAPAPSLIVQQTRGDTTLTIHRAEIIMRSPVLAGEGLEECPEPDPQAEEPECPPFFIGNAFFELPTSTDAATVQSIFVSPGRYDRLSFLLNVPEAGDEEDAEILSQNPGLEGLSVRITGSYNDDSFTVDPVEIAVEERLDLFFPSVLNLQTEDTAVIFLRIDVRSWFLEDGVLINPRTAQEGGDNEAAVAENIRQSFTALTS